MPSIGALASNRARAVAAALALGIAVDARAALVDAVEFYHAALDHYFVTAAADEIGKLDSGYFTGWSRTGQSFKVYAADTPGTGADPVCRFYGNPDLGLDSHFYSASAVECNDVKVKYAGAWTLESDAVFLARLPNLTTGACPAGSVPVYRSWNERVDSNHRYTTDLATQQAMIARGYVAEGYGPSSVAMCSPQLAPGATPTCQIVAGSVSPQVGTPLTLTATCSGSPTSYAWTNCASAAPSCTTSAASAGPQTYTLVATNAVGPGAPSSVTITWVAAPPAEPAPTCSLSVTAQSETPTVNDLVALLGNCSGTPTSYAWSGCTSNSNLCRVRAGSPGVVNYGITAFNASGSGSASMPVAWVAAPAPPIGQCSQFPSALYSSVGSASTSVYSLFFSDGPAFAWNGAWAIKFTVPGSAGAGQFGSLQVAEFGGPPTFREVTVSRSACDFRATDLSGNAGPLGRSGGNSATLAFRIGANSVSVTGLGAGQTYYLNVRNYTPANGTISCTSTQARCDAIATLNLPR